MSNTAKKQIQRMSNGEVKQLAKEFEELSGSLLTKRQMESYLLFTVKDLHVSKVADELDVSCSTIYSLNNRARTKLFNMRQVLDATEEIPWYMMLEIEDGIDQEQDDREKGVN